MLLDLGSDAPQSLNEDCGSMEGFILRLDLGFRIRVPNIADRIKGVSIAGSGISSSPVLVLEHAFRGIGLYERLQVSNSVPWTVS